MQFTKPQCTVVSRAGLWHYKRLTSNLFGVVLAAGCAASIAFYMVWMRPIIMRHGTLRITTLSMAIGALGLWLLVGIPTNQ